jgi:hypothetical protein
MILTCTLQFARKSSTPEEKPSLRHVFAEGLEYYDVVSPRHERGRFVYRPPLAECEVNRKSRKAGHLVEGYHDYEDIDTMKREQGDREHRAMEQIDRYHTMNALFASSGGYL